MTKANTIKDEIIDKGNHIKVSNADDNTVLKALEMAKIKYGSTLDITGNDAFKTKVISLVHKHNLDIKFKDKNMNKTLIALRANIFIKILKSSGTWFLNKIISIVSVLFWITAAIALLFLIVVAVLFIAKQIYEYFGLGWAITFVIVSFFIGIMSPNTGNAATGGRGYSGRSGGGVYSDNGGGNSGYAP
ncbi:MAG: LPD7 domain-containing protein, partial [Tenuifilaceae bacterium]|nr:LPD7 domain-containing protein [Tenuifilaceae bacterium]